MTFETKREAGIGIYRGWFVVFGGLLVAMLVVGVSSHSYGLFVVPASRELGLSRADANNGLILVSFGSALMAPVAGRLMDRYPAPAIIAVGGAAFTAGLLAVAATRSPWVIAAMAVGPVAFGLEFIGGILVTTVAARWFQRRQGLVLGIISTAATGGGVIIAPVTAVLIEAYGWRPALAILAAACGVTALLVAQFLVRSWPAAGEMEAAGEIADRADRAPGGEEDRVRTLRELLTDRDFLLLAATCSLLLANFRVVVTSIAPFLIDGGTGMKDTAFMISVLTGAAVAGKLLCGYLSDRIDPRRILLAIALAHAALLICLVAGLDYLQLMLAIALIGVPVGGVLPLQAVLTARYFGRASFGTAYGLIALIFQPISIVMLRWSGIARDRSGAYDSAFLGLLLPVGLAVLLALLLRPLPAAGQPSTTTGRRDHAA